MPEGLWLLLHNNKDYISIFFRFTSPLKNHTFYKYTDVNFSPSSEMLSGHGKIQTIIINLCSRMFYQSSHSILASYISIAFSRQSQTMHSGKLIGVLSTVTDNNFVTFISDCLIEDRLYTSSESNT